MTTDRATLTTPKPTLATSKRTVERSHRPGLVLAVMSLSIYLVLVDATVVNTALPAIARDLLASTTRLQWIVDGYTLSLAGLVLLGGALGDRYGRRRALAVGLLVFGAASAVAAVAGDGTVLVAMRAAQGVGAALIMPATLSIITNVFPRDQRARAIGIWTGVGSAGIALGPVLGGALVDAGGWSAVFWMHVPVVAIALIGLSAVPESRDRWSRSIDVPGALLSIVASVAFVGAVIEGPQFGWTSPQILTSFGVSAVAVAAFVAVERRSAAPLVPLELFARRDFVGGMVIIGLFMGALVGMAFFLTQFFQLVQGRSALGAGAMLVPYAVGMGIGAPTAGRLVDRVGPRLLVAAATAMAAPLMLWIGQVQPTTSAWSLLAPLTLFGVATGLAIAPLTDTVMAAVPVDRAGVGSAMNDVSRELGKALGIAVLGSAVASLYRSGIADALTGVVSPDVVGRLGDGVGVAVVAAEGFPGPVAGEVVAAAHGAFLDAFAVGMSIAAAALVAGTVAALVLLPRRMRTAQAGDEPTLAIAAD